MPLTLSRRSTRKFSLRETCLLLGTLVLLQGCSYDRTTRHAAEDIGVTAPFLGSGGQSLCYEDHGDPKDKANTVFVHPGLILGSLDWDESLAYRVAASLVSAGQAGSVLELRDRDPTRISERVRSDPGRHFIAVHYSMGGQAQLLAQSIEALENAAKERAIQPTYNPVLVDPYGLSGSATRIDLDSPALGHLFLVLSTKNAFLRPSMDGLDPEIIHHPKTHLLHAEDFGADWGHYGFVTDAVRARTRGEEVFRMISRTVLNDLTDSEIDACLATLKIDYARQDGRAPGRAWIEAVQDLDASTRNGKEADSGRREQAAKKDQTAL